MPVTAGPRTRSIPVFVATVLLVVAGVIFVGLNARSSRSASARLECAGDAWVEQSFMRSDGSSSSDRRGSAVRATVGKAFSDYDTVEPDGRDLVVRSHGRIVGIVHIEDSLVEGVEACAEHFAAE
jgi:hypothetical protein